MVSESYRRATGSRLSDGCAEFIREYGVLIEEMTDTIKWEEAE